MADGTLCVLVGYATCRRSDCRLGTVRFIVPGAVLV